MTGQKFLIRLMIIPFISSLMLGVFACTPQSTSKPAMYALDSDTQGLMEVVENITNTSIVSNDPNVYKAEYEAGFIQGHLQKEQILAMRDNTWDVAYLVNAAHSFPKQIPPSKAEMLEAQTTLAANWQYTLDYVKKEGNSAAGLGLRRLVYRLVGIYHGATREKPESLPFDGQWSPAFSEAEMTLGYEMAGLSFLDLYFINADQDLLDILPLNTIVDTSDNPTKCSAFVKRTKDDIYLTHNSWIGFLDQSQALTLWINGDYLTMNIAGPGLIGSETDFGYNNKGIIFNETTHNAGYSEPNIKSLWMFWRSTLAEQFASSVEDFFKYSSLEPSGTYMNGFMVIDANSKDIGLVEMSFKNFVFYKITPRGDIMVTTMPEGLNREYDKELVQANVLLGINFPASTQIRQDLKSVETRPSRRKQLLAQIDSVNDVEAAKKLITYTDPTEPLSIFGRWDLGYGNTPKPKTVPDGAADAKVIAVSMIQRVKDIKGILDPHSQDKIFWMKFGTPYIKGKPFIWSESQWKGQKLRSVPDRLDGNFVLLNGYIR